MTFLTVTLIALIWSTYFTHELTKSAKETLEHWHRSERTRELLLRRRLAEFLRAIKEGIPWPAWPADLSDLRDEMLRYNNEDFEGVLNTLGREFGSSSGNEPSWDLQSILILRKSAMGSTG